jgi:hypothetical protein
MSSTRHDPGGRPISNKSLRAQAARRAREAISILAEIAQDTNTPAEMRMDAAGMLLAYAFNGGECSEKETHS